MSKTRKPAARTTGSPVALAAHIRSGAGIHADRRTRRLRTRSAQRREAIEHG